MKTSMITWLVVGTLLLNSTTEIMATCCKWDIKTTPGQSNMGTCTLTGSGDDAYCLGTCYRYEDPDSDACVAGTTYKTCSTTNTAEQGKTWNGTCWSEYGYFDGDSWITSCNCDFPDSPTNYYNMTVPQASTTICL